MKYFVLNCLLILLLASCSPKRYIYVREDKKPEQDSTFYITIKRQYVLQPGDIIYISIHSSLSDTKGMFHFPGQEQVGSSVTNQGGSMYLNQFVIADDGTISIPVIGKVYIAGSTVEETEKIIEFEAQKYVTDALARVKLVSYEITFMGEFAHVGKINFYEDRLNILDAIAEAGEVTYYGDRKNVRVLRQTPDGLNTFRIDLTNKSLLTSDKFFLQPNDIIYAEPLPRKIFRVNAADYSIILTTISSTLALIAVILTLK
jgi:polysaccharide biosynthesis/export protein